MYFNFIMHATATCTCFAQAFQITEQLTLLFNCKRRTLVGLGVLETRVHIMCPA